MNLAQLREAQPATLIAPTVNRTLRRPSLHGIEYRFGLLLAIFGMVFAFVVPPVQVPDEPTHLIHAYSVAHGDWLPAKDADGWAATDMPVSLLVIYPTPTTEDQSKWQAIRGLMGVQFNGERRPVSIGHLSIYSFFPYVPQAVGIRVARLLRLRPLLVMYAGRMSNLGFAVFCVVLAIRLTPIGKLLFGAIALLPLSVQQFASLSADAPTNGLCLLLVAALLRLALTSGTGRPAVSTLALLFLTLAVALTKFPYTVVVLLYFGTKPNQADSRCRYWLTGMLILAVAAAGVATSIALTHSYLPDPHYFTGLFTGQPLSQSAQLHFILTHPAQYLWVCLNSVVQRGFGWVHTLFVLGSLDTPLNYLTCFGYLFFLAALAIVDGMPEGPLSWRLWSVGAAVVVLSAGAIFTSQYLWWNAVANTWIEGPQGRYFIPLLPLLFLLLRNAGIRATADERFVISMTLSVSVLLLCYALATLLNRFYFRPVPLLLSPPWLLAWSLSALALCWTRCRWLLDHEPAAKDAPSALDAGSSLRQAA